MYDYQTLTLTNIDGSISPFTNGASGLILLGTGSSTPPEWGTLSSVNTGLSNGVARIQDNHLVSGAIALGSTDTAGILPVTKGGTGIGTQGIEGILVGNGTSNFSAVSTSGVSNGDVLAKTANGYAFITLGSATVPPIIDLQSGATSANIGQFLKVNNDLEPEWADIGSIVGDYLPLAGGRMDGPDMSGKYASVLSTWIGETSGWYTGLTHGFWDGTHRNASATSNVFRVTTKIGTQNVEFGDYIIRIHGYNTADSSETVDYYVYLSNTTNNAKGRYLQAVRGFRNKGSILPLTFVAYGHDSSTDCLSLQFTLTEQKNLVLAVDFISHDLARGNIIDRNSYDYQALSGWNLHADEASSGSGSPLNILEKIISDGAITDIPSGSGSATSKVLIGGNGATATPTWSAIGDINTGLSNGIVRVNSGNFTVTGNPVSVAEGGTGKDSLTAYAILAGGTTNTGQIQQLGTGTSGQLLVSGGSGALPTWTNLTNISTGLSAGIAKIDSSGKLTSNPTVSLATEVSGNILDIAPNSTNEGYLLAVKKTTTNNVDTYSSEWVAPTSIGKAYKIPQTGWYRIAENVSAASAGFGNFVVRISSTVVVEFSVVETLTRHPQISIKNFTTNGYSGGNIDKIRVLYIDNNSGSVYIDVHFIDSSTTTARVNIYNYFNFSLKEPETTTETETTIPEGYLCDEYALSRNEYGLNGQFLKTNRTVNSNVTTYSKSWETLPTIPSAPSSLPLVDNETGALGTAGTYANANHQHPLPYSVQAAYKFFYPRKIGIGGAITAEAQEYDGTSDLILQATQIDPNAIINTVPIEKGGTGATTASAALTNLGAAASNHNHDGTYLKLSGGTLTGGITFGSSVTEPITWTGNNGVAVFTGGVMSATSNVNGYVSGRRESIIKYETTVSSSSGSPTDIVHQPKTDTIVNIVAGATVTQNYTRYINLPTPTAEMLGDEITVYFTDQSSATGTLYCTCSTDERIIDYEYEKFFNTVGATNKKNCKWSKGNVVKFTCINFANGNSTYYWRAVKLVEQSWQRNS